MTASEDEPTEQEALNRLMIEMMEADREEVSRMAATSAQVLEAKGRREGQKNLVLLLLQKRFGDLPTAMSSRIRHLPAEQLEELAIALLEFADLSEVQNRLATHSR